MVNKNDSLDEVFHALSDRTRRSMLECLSRGPCTIGDLGRPFDVTKPAITKHVRVLERAGLLLRTVDGRLHRCAIDHRPLTLAERWVADVQQYWGARFDDLAAVLKRTQLHSPKKTRRRTS